RLTLCGCTTRPLFSIARRETRIVNNARGPAHAPVDCDCDVVVENASHVLHSSCPPPPRRHRTARSCPEVARNLGIVASGTFAVTSFIVPSDCPVSLCRSSRRLPEQSELHPSDCRCGHYKHDAPLSILYSVAATRQICTVLPRIRGVPCMQLNGAAARQ
ncbi:hypothetical protein P154DRAFT_358420, partial [Amniculicola lignicola CBS 123094]